MEDYAFTIKFNVKRDCSCNVTVCQYDDVIALWQHLGCDIVDYVLERDSNNCLHAHGIVSIPVNLFRKRLMTTGMHMKLDMITDREGWINYIKKHQASDSDTDVDEETYSYIIKMKQELGTNPSVPFA